MSSLKKIVAGGALATAITAGTIAEASDAKSLLLRDVSIVDTRTGEIADSKAILVVDGIIQEIMDADTDAGEGTTIIEGGGRYVVPGLNDMHVHVLEAASDANADHDHSSGFPEMQEIKLKLMLANGITGFRQMSGSPEIIKAAEALNNAISSGETKAPRALSTTGDLFLGQAPTPDAARQFVKDQIAAGSDFLKVVEGPREPLLAALAEAETANLPVAGHLPRSISTKEAIDAGWDAFEHWGSIPGVTLDCAHAGPAIRQKMNETAANGPVQLPPTFLLNPLRYVGNQMAPALGGIAATFDPNLCGSLAQSFVDNDVWQVPTLIRLRTMSFGSAPEYREDANLKYLPEPMQQLWQKIGAEFDTEVSPEAKTAIEANYDLLKRMTKMMKDSGVKMLAGSDLGGIWVLPGFSLHQEFSELKSAGLSPLDVLQMATLNAGEFLRLETQIGAVEKGFRADLVLLDENPIESVEGLNAVSGVLIAGSYLDESELEELKQAALDISSH